MFFQFYFPSYLNLNYSDFHIILHILVINELKKIDNFFSNASTLFMSGRLFSDIVTVYHIFLYRFIRWRNSLDTIILKQQTCPCSFCTYLGECIVNYLLTCVASETRLKNVKYCSTTTLLLM